ncbi:MAG: AAA family ATPase [Acidimicrobiales bacterium]
MPQRSNETQLIDEVPLVLRRHWSLLVLVALLVAAFVLGGRWALAVLAVLAVLWGVFVPAPLNLPRRCLRTISHPDGAPLLRARLFRQVLASCQGVKLPVRLIFEDYEREGKYLDPRAETFEVRLWPGEHLELWRSGRGEALRHGFEAERVKVTEARPGVVRVSVLYEDPLRLLPGEMPPHVTRGLPVDFLSDPVPLGRSEDGEGVLVSMKDAHMLIGGQPGTGKSAIHLVIAWAALDPSALIVLLDGKGLSELDSWVPVCWRAAANLGQAEAVLADVEGERQRRVAARLAQGQRTWPMGAIPPVLVAIDELAVFTDLEGLSGKEKTQVQRVRRLLSELVRLGRADRIMVVAATQKPDSSVVPTAIRDQMQLRLALRCATREHSDTILGSGTAAQGADASQIVWGSPGSFILAGTSERPAWGRAWWMSDDRLAAVVKRAERLRFDVGTPVAPAASLPALGPGELRFAAP